MIARLRPASGLLAAVALWGLALGLLAVLGLGGNVGPHPENPALAPPLPDVRLVELHDRLGPLPRYSEIAARPLMNPDRRPSAVADAAAPEDAPFEAVLTSVLIAGDLRLAILERTDDPTAHRVRVGEFFPGTGWRLVEVAPRSAVFEGPQGRRELALRVFDGTGAPMPLAAAPPAGAAAGSDEAADAAEVPVAPPTPERPPGLVGAGAAEITPEQQVEAIRRRIEARRAMRAQEAARERAGNRDNR